MDYELREGLTNAFNNGFKKPGDKQPDFKGDILNNGIVKELALWKKKTRNGETFWFCKLSTKREGAGQREPTDYVVTPTDEDIPF